MSQAVDDNPWRMYKCLSCGKVSLKRDRDEKTCDCGGELMRRSEYLRRYGADKKTFL